MKTLIATLAVICFTNLLAITSAQNVDEEFNETAMIFWTVCSSIPMYETMHGNSPKTSKELLDFLDEMGKDNDQIKKWVIVLKSGRFSVVDKETIEANEPYIQFQAKGEKVVYTQTKNGKIQRMRAEQVAAPNPLPLRVSPL